ncbi:cytochrome P450 CYP82D47-like protein, partial [Tanacetum coccineum]
ESDSASSVHYSSGEDVDGDEYDDDDDYISPASPSSHRIHCIFMWLLFLIYADFTGVVMLLALLSALVISGKPMNKIFKEVDDILERWLKEQKIERESPPQQQGNQVFMKTLLSVLEDASPEEYLAALDTTSATLTWTLSLLLNNPKASEIAQAEMDEVAESLNFLHNNAQLIHGAISPEIVRIEKGHGIKKEGTRDYGGQKGSIMSEVMDSRVSRDRG